jgi:cAMP-dependent protein kinase regulator
MKLFTGYLIADHAIKRSSCHRELAAGEVVFHEGDPASGLFIVLEGRIEIVKTGESGDVRLAEVGPNGVFGEMGLVAEGSRRSATARATEPSVVLEVANNPVQMLREMGETDAAIVLMKQVICALSEWLRSGRGSTSDTAAPVVESGRDEEAAMVIKSHLPKAFYQWNAKRVPLPAGTYLCHQGDRPDGFYFLHSGTLEILKRDSPDDEEKVVGEIKAPAVAGEVGYFANERRLASLRAKDEVSYSPFSDWDFEDLQEENAEKALDVLMAAARSVVALIR